MTTFSSVSASFDNLIVSGNLYVSGTFTAAQGLYVDNLITVGLPGSSVQYNSIKTAVDSITDATAFNTYTVEVAPGVYIEDTITVPSYVAVRGDSSTSTIVSASNPNNGIFILSDQSMVIDMQIQGSTGTGASAILYSSATTPQLNAIAYAENIRFGSNYTNASTIGLPGGNCILQCSNVKYGGATANNKSFDIGFRISGSGGGIGRMQLRNVTSTNGGITGSADQIFALADASGCTFIVNGCLLTKAVGSTLGTGFKVYNGGSLRLTGVNFQRWAKGIWAPQTGSAPSIDAIALNFENCTTDVAIEHSGSTGKVQGTDNFLKTQINLSASLYEVGQDPRIITVATKGGDFTSISASVAYITDSAANNRYVIQVGPGQFTEKEIDLTNKPYVSIVGSSIQTTQIFPSGSNQHLIKMGINNEVSFLSLTNAPTGYSALYVDDVGDFAQAHKLSFYDCDTCITVISRTQDTKFYGEYVDFNGTYRTGSFVSSSNGFLALASLENYYQFPVSSPGLIGNYGTGGVAEIDIYNAGLIGELDANSVAIRLENGADLQGTAMDIPRWGYAVYVPNLANSASFNIVGTMIHDSVNLDFNILHPSASCRFQGTADHTKIANNSADFFWTFLDETDGELDITRNLAVTFQNGTHTDASTLIFRGSPMGVMEGGLITTSSNGPNVLEIDITAGFGYIEDENNPGVYRKLSWTTRLNYTDIADDSENYLYVYDEDTIAKSQTEPNNIQNIILGRVYCAAGRIEFIDQSPRNASHTANLLTTFNRTALGPVYAQGSIATINGRSIDLSSGIYFFGENQFNPTGGTQISMRRYYRDTAQPDGWARQIVTEVPINQWDSGSNALVALSASYYTKHTLYGVNDGAEERYFLITGQEQFSTLVAAEGANLPTPPTYFKEGVVPLAAVYVQSGSATITQIEDIRPIIGFRAGGVNASSDHGNLLGLADDDHTQYLLVNGTRAMTGPLTASIVSASSGFVGNLTGTASTASYVTGSVFTSTNPALSASYALTASYALFSPSGGGNIALSAGTTSTNLSSIVFANSNNVNFGLNGSTITANAPIAISAGAASSNISSLVFSNSNGVSFGLNGNTITATVAAAAANITVSAGTATSAVSSLVFSNSNNVSFGLNGNTITATATVASTQGSINISAGNGSSQNLSALVFSNSNGVSFGLNNGTITATINAGGGGNITVSAGTVTNAVSSLVFSNSNNVSFGLDGSTITAAVPSYPTLAYWDNMQRFGGSATNNLGSAATVQNQVYVFPLGVLNGDMTISTLMFNMSHSATGNSSSAPKVFTVRFGLYTLNGSTLSILNSVSAAYSIAANAANSTAYSGQRWIQFNSTDWSVSPAVSAEREYYGAFFYSSGGNNSAAQTAGFHGYFNYSTAVRSGVMNVSQTTANSLGHYPWLGVHTVTGVLPTSVNLSDLNKRGASSNFIPHVVFNNLSSYI